MSSVLDVDSNNAVVDDDKPQEAKKDNKDTHYKRNKDRY